MYFRVIQGLATALGVSAVYAMWGNWAPVEERATLVGIVFTGNMFANAVVFPTSALLCRHGFAGGWPSVFYVFGIVGFLWCILWAVFVFETPETHPRIDPKEKKYIMSTSSSARNKKHTVRQRKSTHNIISTKHIFKSPRNNNTTIKEQIHSNNNNDSYIRQE